MNKEMLELGSNRSIIRELFEFSKQKKQRTPYSKWRDKMRIRMVKRIPDTNHRKNGV